MAGDENMKCAYCGREARGTKEHIISSGILDLFPECYLTFDEKRGVIHQGDPMIKDVCADCNNNKISYIDSYAKNFIGRYFVKNYGEDEQVKIEYDYTMIQKVLLKYAFNDLRSRRDDISYFDEELLQYLMNESNRVPKEYISVLAGLAVNVSPAPDFMFGNLKLRWCKNPVFYENSTIRHINYETGQVFLNDECNQNNPNGYYNMLKKAVDEGKYELSGVATTNYNQFIQEILQYDVSYLNGSTEIWYDPYVNKMGSKASLDTNEHHILVPLMFTQSGTKPMTSIDMSMVYVDTYKKWKQSDAIVVVGFGFGVDDEHINGILRTLIDSDNKKVIVVTLDSYEEDGKIIKGICRKLKVANSSNVELIKVDYSGIVSGTDKKWTDYLA